MKTHDPTPPPQRPQWIGTALHPAEPRPGPVPIGRAVARDLGDRSVLIEPDGVCPACGTPPALRIAPRLADHADGGDPDEPLASYRCQRRALRSALPAAGAPLPARGVSVMGNTLDRYDMTE